VRFYLIGWKDRKDLESLEHKRLESVYGDNRQQSVYPCDEVLVSTVYTDNQERADNTGIKSILILKVMNKKISSETLFQLSSTTLKAVHNISVKFERLGKACL
jgi:hypothetical protein